jgi:PAS domain S-box-containing protein
MTCLAYTIYKFSDYYQALHEAQLTNYTQTLELMVEKRTKQLAESEYKYRTLVEKIRDGYFVTQNGRITFANKAFCEMHGYKKREIIGRECAELIAHQSLEEVRHFYENRVKRDGVRYQYAYLRRNKDGTALPTENSVSRAIYQGKMALIGICRDITERVEMERRVREAKSCTIGHLTTSLCMR